MQIKLNKLKIFWVRKKGGSWQGAVLQRLEVWPGYITPGGVAAVDPLDLRHGIIGFHLYILLTVGRSYVLLEGRFGVAWIALLSERRT